MSICRPALFAAALATALSLFHSTASAQSELGRLFYSPVERAALDRLRASGGKAEGAPAESIVYEGVVRRRDGKSTAFINGAAVRENDELPAGIPAQGVLVLEKRAPHATNLNLPSGKVVRIKPGQAYELDGDAVREGFTEPAMR